jgi:sterol desaturase/sphingolipid hydroxylase (fatty acid hydroxylase superfamily)
MLITSFILPLLLGVLAWTFAEYALHNWVGHGRRGRGEFSREHLAHHTDGTYFTATSQKVAMAVRILLVVVPIGLLVAGVLPGLSFSVGFVATWIGYEVLHRRLHTHPPRGRYGRWARRHHFAHHFSSAKVNHGVTSPLWDLVFRTYRRPGRIHVPEREAMSWLWDPQAGDVKACYAADYAIRRGKRRKNGAPRGPRRERASAASGERAAGPAGQTV